MIVACIASVSILLAPKHQEVEHPNIVLILVDDLRHDTLGFIGHPFLETPAIDRLAREGVHFSRSVVTTSLCSPSRASILTGLYAHNHGVVDNYNPVDPQLTFFPELLQEAGYETAFVGKWHMGDLDDPQRGFDHWVSFRGQGLYYPDGHGTTRNVPQENEPILNVNGKRVPQQGYITDELTDYAINWLEGRANEDEPPFFLYLSHKAVHSDFVPADRHRGRYRDQPVPLPSVGGPNRGAPRWLIDQQNSRHGVGFAYNLAEFDLASYYRRYCEAILAVDENLGRLLDALDHLGSLEDTLIVFMGDNGFQFGEQGLIDKRTAYEASIRVPLLMRLPGVVSPGATISETVANIDIAPTLLDAAGIHERFPFDGQSVWHLATCLKKSQGSRDALLYEYFWERNYPQTPTTHAVLEGRWKYIRYHGIWDTDELFDLQNDPDETVNLIADLDRQEIVERLHRRLFELLEQSTGNSVPLLPDRGRIFPWRKPTGPEPGSFPSRFMVPSEPELPTPPWARGIR